MKKLLLLALLLAASAAAAPPVLPVGATGSWHTDLYLRNTTTGVLVQQVGQITYTAPGFDPIVLRPTMALHPGQIRWIPSASKAFDDGLFILPVTAGVEASSFLTFDDGAGHHTSFEVGAISAAISSPGDKLTFYRIATSFDPPTGTFPLFLNTGDAAQTVEIRTYGSDMTLAGTQFVIVPPGVSIAGVHPLIPDGGAAEVCMGACGVGGGGAGGFPPLYVVMVVGPPDGSTQIVRYAE